MRKTYDDVYVEPPEYFTPEMLRVAEEWEREHGEPDINCGVVQPIEMLPEEETITDCAGIQPPEMLPNEE